MASVVDVTRVSRVQLERAAPAEHALSRGLLTSGDMWRD